MTDFRYALRLLLRAPGHTATAVLALALGIGATVAIFSAAYTTLYRPLPIPDPQRLVVPVGANAERGIERASIPLADVADWRAEKGLFERVAVYRETAVDLAGEGTPERVEGLQVTEDYFALMRTRPIVGRLLTESDYAPDAAPVVVIGDALWRRRFGGDPQIAGREIRLAGTVMTIAGVIDSARAWPDRLNVWLPLRTALQPEDVRTRRDNMIFQAVARLAPDVPLQQANARIAAIAARIERDHPTIRKGWTTELVPAKEYLVEPEMHLGMLILLGGVGFVLLIACVNLANLTLARGADRTREIALRSALGASRTRIVRQLMTESLVVACAGGAAGLLAARWLLQGLQATAPSELTMLEGLGLDVVALVAAIGLTVATAVLFGLAPAVAASRFEPAGTLRDGGRGTGAGRQGGRLRDALVVAEIALAIVLLTGAGLMLRSFGRLLDVDPGVDVDRILAGRVSLQGARYSDASTRRRFYDQLTTALAARPDVEAAAATSVPAGGRPRLRPWPCLPARRTAGAASDRGLPGAVERGDAGVLPHPWHSRRPRAGLQSPRHGRLDARHDHQRDHGPPRVRRPGPAGPKAAVVAR